MKTFKINYKGFVIHGFTHKPEVTVNSSLKEFKSIHAAKCHITRVMIPAHDAAMVEFSKRVTA